MPCRVQRLQGLLHSLPAYSLPLPNEWQVVGAGSGPRAARRQQQLPPNVVVAHLGEPSCFALLRFENLCAYSLLLVCCSVRPDSLAALEHQPCHPLLWLLHQPVPFCPARRPVQSKASRPSTCSAGAPCAACTCPTRVSCGGRQGQLCVPAAQAAARYCSSAPCPVPLGRLVGPGGAPTWRCAALPLAQQARHAGFSSPLGSLALRPGHSTLAHLHD